MTEAAEFTRRNRDLRRLAVADSASVIGLDYAEIRRLPREGSSWLLLLHFISAGPHSAGKIPTPANLALNQIEIFAEPVGKPAAFDVAIVEVAAELASAGTAVVPLKLSLKQGRPPLTPDYKIRLVNVANLDPMFTEANFALNIDEPSDVDPRKIPIVPPPAESGPPIDYLAKDYASFTSEMFARLSMLVPGFSHRNPADIGVALVETVCYAADLLSYDQDAAGTEAYLGTARRRVSISRLSRLLDYRLSEGCNARAWVAIEIDAGDGTVLPGPTATTAGTPLMTGLPDEPVFVPPADIAMWMEAGAQVFETMADVTLYRANNEIRFYTWMGDAPVIPAGATSATILAGPTLGAGSVIILEQTAPAPGGGAAAPANAAQAVRLVSAPTSVTDPLRSDLQLLRIEWHPDDALASEYHVGIIPAADGPRPATVARGNVVLVDHGLTIAGENLGRVPFARAFQPILQHEPVTQQRQTLGPGNELVAFNPRLSAKSATETKTAEVLPAVWLQEGRNGPIWQPVPDLLSSGRFARDFVLEIRDEGYSQIRFGNGQNGRKPESGIEMTATYRLGNGQIGNVGYDRICRMVGGFAGLVIASIRNPIAAAGGIDAENVNEARVAAPEAYHRQERAVTAADYALIAQRLPAVQKALADLRWNGSWFTARLTVERAGGKPVGRGFEKEIAAYLEQFRLAGLDLAVAGPVYVSLDIALAVAIDDDTLPQTVNDALKAAFSTGFLPDGRSAFFNPANWTFGQPVYLNQIIQAALDVPGVRHVRAERFQRLAGGAPAGDRRNLYLPMGRNEIARVGNDPQQPSNGLIRFALRGGA